MRLSRLTEAKYTSGAKVPNKDKARRLGKAVVSLARRTESLSRYDFRSFDIIGTSQDFDGYYNLHLRVPIDLKEYMVRGMIARGVPVDTIENHAEIGNIAIIIAKIPYLYGE